MKYSMLLALPALQEVLSSSFRQVKYSLFPPLSLLTIAGMTPEEKYDVTVRDEHVEKIDDGRSYDIVGMTVYISSAKRSYQLADMYRRRGAKVVLGGIHPTSMPEEAAQHADAICMGPAEPVWPQILRDFEKGRLGKIYKGECRGSASLVPLAKRGLMNRKAYLVKNTMVLSRGCPNACDFCYKAGFWGKSYYERRPFDGIEKELSGMEGGFVFFLDDNFMADRSRARDVFSRLRDSGMVWQASADLDAAGEPGFLEEAYEAGCRSLFVGFESLSAENMRANSKKVNASADYGRAVKRFHDAGIMINGSFVFGFDCDGPDVFARTLDFAIENRIETATFHILTPFPGTPLFDRMRKQGRLLHRDWDLYDTRHAVFRPKCITPGKLEDGYNLAYRDFYKYGSILRRSLGLPGALKRIAYNVGWRKMDSLWSFAIKAGMISFIRPIFERILASGTRRAGLSGESYPSAAVSAAPAATVN